MLIWQGMSKPGEKSGAWEGGKGKVATLNGTWVCVFYTVVFPGSS